MSISVFEKIMKKRLEKKNGVNIKNLYACQIDKLDIRGDGTIRMYSYVDRKLLAKDKEKFKDPLGGKEYYESSECSKDSALVVYDSRSIRNFITREELKKGYISKARLQKINAILAK